MCYSCLKYVLEFQESCETKKNERDKLSYPEGYVNWYFNAFDSLAV